MDGTRQWDPEQQDALLAQLREWAATLGFSQIGVADVNLAHAEAGLLAWLHNGFHGSMDYKAFHGLKRGRPAAPVPGPGRLVPGRRGYPAPDPAHGWRAVGGQGPARPTPAGAR